MPHQQHQQKPSSPPNVSKMHCTSERPSHFSKPATRVVAKTRTASCEASSFFGKLATPKPSEKPPKPRKTWPWCRVVLFFYLLCFAKKRQTKQQQPNKTKQQKAKMAIVCFIFCQTMANKATTEKTKRPRGPVQSPILASIGAEGVSLKTRQGPALGRWSTSKRQGPGLTDPFGSPKNQMLF